MQKSAYIFHEVEHNNDNFDIRLYIDINRRTQNCVFKTTNFHKTNFSYRVFKKKYIYMYLPIFIVKNRISSI